MNKINSIGVILDGNRRWAKKNQKSKIEGYRKGLMKTVDLVKWCDEMGIKELLIYAFSSSNWGRDKESIDSIKVVLNGLEEYANKLINETQMRVKFMGSYEKFGDNIESLINRVEEKSRNNGGIKIGVCLSYTGRDDIIKAVNKIIDKGDKITEDVINKSLSTNGFQNPDLIIRTGGTRRLSGFLPWESIYSELYFLDEYWPDFTKQKFTEILEDYKNIDIKMGG